MEYAVTRLPEGCGAYELSGGFDPAHLPAPWKDTGRADIMDYPWISAYPAHYEAAAHLGINSSGLRLLMYAYEEAISARETRFGGSVCRDSCLEFFFMPFPKSDRRYLNIEINPAGTAHVGIGEGRPGRKVFYAPVPGMTIRTFVKDGSFWALSAEIPADFVRAEFGAFPQAGDVMKGNFYKCSEDIHEHYGVWAHVGTPAPDFHTPEYFGDLLIL
ncbi:MAG: carbohydrate-binding family 9-like protein [Clostridia bacterium]|nr:carbohydrate-binding family 9-like protein [Clostridia bacterium]